jgi:hypothetical protein
MTENDQQRDLEKLESYAELLVDNAPSIALALYCGATIGRAVSSGSLGQRMLEGTTILSKALQFDKATMQQVRDWLAEYAGKFATEVNHAPLPPLESLGLNSAAPEPWVALKWIMDVVPKEPISLADLPGFYNSSARNWNERCSSYLIGRPAKAPRALPEDMLSRASGGRFFGFLNFDLSEMTLRDWSNAFYWTATTAVELPKSRGRIDYCPPWLLAVALNALGLGFDQLPKRLEPTDLNADERSDWDAMASLVVDRRHTDRFKALIIKHPASSTVDSWKMTAKNTAAVFTGDEYVELRRHSVTFKEGLFGAVIFDSSVSREHVAEILETMSWTDTTGRFWYISDQRTPEKLDAPLVTTPKDLDDAVSRGLKGWQRRARGKREESPQDYGKK